MKLPAFLTTLGWFTLVLVSGLGQGAQPGEKKADAAQAEAEKLEGSWKEVYPPDEKKLRNVSADAVLSFKGKTVYLRFVQTIDGMPIPGMGTSRDGTFKVDATGKVKTIDFLFKPDRDFEQNYQGIYEFEGDTLKLCMSPNKRPTTFERKGDRRFFGGKTQISLFVLKRQPKF